MRSTKMSVAVPPQQSPGLKSPSPRSDSGHNLVVPTLLFGKVREEVRETVRKGGWERHESSEREEKSEADDERQTVQCIPDCHPPEQTLASFS